eukprot:gene25926-biopygen11848
MSRGGCSRPESSAER